MKSFNTPICNCLNCGTRLDAASNPFEDGRPERGDLTICLRCGHLMAFRKNLTVRELSGDEIVNVAGDKRILALQEARVAAMKTREDHELLHVTPKNGAKDSG